MALPRIAGFSLPLIAAAAVGAIAIGVGVALITDSGGSGGDGQVTLGPSVTPGAIGTITAEGEFAYVTTDLRVGLTDAAGNAPQVISDFDGVSRVLWSTDGSLLAAQVTSGRERVVVITPSGEELFEVDGASDPAWSPVGNQLLVLRDSTAVVVDESGVEIRSVPEAAGAVWSPDGSSIAYLRVDDEAMVVPVILDLESGEESLLDDGIEPGDPTYPIAWHPAEDLIAYRDRLYDLSTRDSRPLEGVPVSWSPDGRLLLQTLDRDESVSSTNARLFDFTAGPESLQTREDCYELLAHIVCPIIGFLVRDSVEGEQPWVYLRRWYDWSPDGRTFFYLDPRPFDPILRVYDTLAQRQRSFMIEGEEPDISPDGTHAAFSQGQKLWVLALDESAFQDVVDGIRPQWRPVP